MFQAAALKIAVLEKEGLYAPLLREADLLASSSEDALALLLDFKRLISGLRK
jgi:soluble P-type ATPase